MRGLTPLPLPLVWVALWGGGAVVCLDGRTGRERARIALPVSQPTSCAFGGADLYELFITSARHCLPEDRLAGEPLAGNIFRARPGVRGAPVSQFATST
jgi:sugar lactone lactonase YvrE